MEQKLYYSTEIYSLAGNRKFTVSKSYVFVSRKSTYFLKSWLFCQSTLNASCAERTYHEKCLYIVDLELEQNWIEFAWPQKYICFGQIIKPYILPHIDVKNILRIEEIIFFK